MPIYPRSQGYHIKVQVKGKLHREQFNGDETAARIREAQIKADLRGGRHITPVSDPTDPTKGMTLGDLCERTTARYWRGKPSEKVQTGNARMVLEVLGKDREITSISEDDIDTLITTFVSEGNLPNTVNRKLSAVSRMLHYAAKRRWIDRCPEIELLPVTPSRVRWISDEEETAALDYFRSLGDQDMVDVFILGVDTGFRIDSELLSLPTADVHFSTNKIVVHPDETKGKRSRSVPMTRRVQELVRRRISQGAITKLFSISYRVAWKRWNRMREHLGLKHDEHFTPHVMRHTFCSRLTQRGVHLHTIKELAGHAKFSQTLAYAHLAPEQHQDAIAVLEPDGHNAVNVVTFPVTNGDFGDGSASHKAQKS